MLRCFATRRAQLFCVRALNREIMFFHLRRYCQFILIAFLTGLVGICCRKDSPVEPPKGIQKTARDYTWSIDSIDYKGSVPVPLELTGMWGGSPSDLWGVAGDSDPDDALWHRDGTSWTRATKNTIFTNYTGYRAVYDVWGSAAKDVWAVGFLHKFGIGSAMIVHYNGSAWADVTPPAVKSIDGVLYTIHGNSKNDIWAGGYEYAVHYNGINWIPYKVADSMIVASIASVDTNIFVTAYSPWGKNIWQLYQFSNGTFRLLDQTTPYFSSQFGLILWLQDRKLTSMDPDIYSNSIRNDATIDTAAWQKEYDTGDRVVANFFSISPTSVIAVGSLYLALHFNGTDWKEINIRGSNDPGHSLSTLAALWSDANEAFICNYHDGIIYHGR